MIRVKWQAAHVSGVLAALRGMPMTPEQLRLLMNRGFSACRCGLLMGVQGTGCGRSGVAASAGTSAVWQGHVQPRTQQPYTCSRRFTPSAMFQVRCILPCGGGWYPYQLKCSLFEPLRGGW